LSNSLNMVLVAVPVADTVEPPEHIACERVSEDIVLAIL